MDNTELAAANKYHAEITAAHAGAGGGAIHTQQLLLAMQAEFRTGLAAVREECNGIQEDLGQRAGDLTNQIRTLGDQINRVEQMSAVVRHPFSSA